MSLNYNRIVLAGHLTKDAELRYTTGGSALCVLGLAVNYNYADKAGNDKKEVCFVDATAFGKTGEIIAKHFRKGDPILIEGRLRLENWEDKSGQKRSKHSISIDNFRFVGSKGERTSNAEPAPPAASAPSEKPTQGQGSQENDSDDIPF